MALRELRINNVVIIPDARFEPGPGFTVLTGETGSGKSVCVAALRLALGMRVESDLIAADADRARVAAVFDNISEAVRARLDAAGVAIDDELLTLSRDLPREGRTTCRINGALVSQSVLRDVGEVLVEITAQGASQRILHSTWQRQTLDAFGGATVKAARDDVEAAVERWRALQLRLEEARRLEQSSAAEVERARDTVADLAPLGLRSGEDDELVAERMRLRHAVAIADATERLHRAGSGEEGAPADLLRAALVDLEPLSSAVPELHELAEDAADLLSRLIELSAQARRVNEALSADPGRLGVVEERLDIVARIKRRYGSIDEALATLGSAAALVAAVDDGVGEAGSIAAEVEGARAAAGAGAARLSTLREAAGRKLEAVVMSELRQLEMARARFRIVLRRTPHADGVTVDGAEVRCTAHGIDDVEFRLASNAGGVPVPLAEGPSGGELSRLALALRASAADDCPTLVLDEIDSGVGGETAARVGEVLARIAESRQVIAITHRPEIAARAAHHRVTSKTTVHGVTRAQLASCDDAERVDEIARLMSGRLTEAARRRAAELLGEGRPAAGSRAQAPA